MSLRRKIILGILALLLLVPTIVLYYIVTTESGLQFVARRLGKMGTVTVTAADVSGTLVGGFRIGSLRIQHRLSDVQINDATGRVKLLPLLVLQRIRIPDLKVQYVSVKVLRDPVKRPPRPPRFLPALLRIDADAVQVASADVILLSGRTLHATDVSGGMTMLPQVIRIHGAQLDTSQTHVAVTGHVLAAQPIAFDGELEARYVPTGLPAWLFAAKFDGDLARLPMSVRIEQPFHATVEGAATTLNTHWEFGGHAIVRDFDLRPFGGGNALGIIAGELDLAASNDGFTAKGALTPPGLKSGPVNVDFSGEYGNKRLTIRQANLLHAPSGSRATVRGTVDVVPHGPKLGLTGEWSNFRWPLSAKEPAFLSPRGRYTLAGIKPWQTTAAGDVIAAGQPAMPAQLRGLLGGEALTIEDASVQLLGGNARVTGEARWKPAESWSVAGHMSDLDPALLRADLPGKLGFDFKANGAPFGDAGTIDFDIAKLAGTLRAQNATGKGHFTRPGGATDWQFHGVDLRFGRTHVQLDGGLGAKRDLKFAVDADDLSLFDPAARGRLSARGRYAGTVDAPILLFKARGTDFEWQERKLAAIDADVDIDLGAGGHTQGQIDLTGLQLGARTAQKMTIELSGDNALQRIAMNLEAAPLRAALSAQGSMHEGLWTGSMQSLSITDAQDLALRLEAPAALRLSAARFEQDRLCLKGTQERLCAAGRREADGAWHTDFSAESLPLRALTAGLTQDIAYEGTINVQGELAGTSNALPTGSVRGELRQAQLRHSLGNGRDERLALGSGSVAASATTSGFNMQVGLDAGSSGNFHGELTGDRNTGDWRDYPIRGSLDASTDGLALLDIYVGGIDKATGRLSTKVNISGTLGHPSVQGLVQLRDASIDIYQVNLALRDLSLDARFDTEALDLSGQSKLGNGTANFNGRLAWKQGEPYGNLHVGGENLMVVNVPEAHIEASPNLDFKLAGRRIDATGEVRVPVARLEPADLTNAVLSSSDEVLVGAPVIDPAKRWLVVSDIRLVLGDQVNINSLGLTAKLGGSISVRTDESGISRGLGELNITSGRYAALGRLLDIQRGRLLFNNGPLGDPGVDLRAQKVFPDVTAGVNVRGSLRAPRLTFFSEPAIPQSQIASLILAGGSLESVQNSQRPGAARNDLLAQGGAILAQRVGSRVGVDDVGIESDLTNETSLVVGKYLAPRLYVSYGISLAEAINTLKLRYTIGDRWTIKTEAGKARSADIVYTIKK
jgi:translocation and assembly module TamB